MEHKEKNEALNFLDDFKTEERHSNLNVYKGLGAFFGIYVFFLIEKIVQIRQDYKENKVI